MDESNRMITAKIAVYLAIFAIGRDSGIICLRPFLRTDALSAFTSDLEISDSVARLESWLWASTALVGLLFLVGSFMLFFKLLLLVFINCLIQYVLDLFGLLHVLDD